jgi:hypothetical protein
MWVSSLQCGCRCPPESKRPIVSVPAGPSRGRLCWCRPARPPGCRYGRRFLYFFHLQVQGGVVYAAPIDVILSETTIVQPDVCYLGEAKLSQVMHHGIVGPPPSASAIARAEALWQEGRR